MIKKLWYLYRNIKIGIKNLVVWGPTIWKDRQWDHYFIYSILSKKLSMVEHFMKNYGNHTKSEEDAQRVHQCVLLLERLKNDEYFENAFKQHDKKWGKRTFRWDDIPNSELVELNIDYENVKSEKDDKLQTKEFRIACKHEAYLRQQDINFLFKTMAKYIQGWWD